MGEFVRLEVDGAVGTIRLDRPKMNALNAQVQEEIRACAVEATARTDIRAVILYGGERVFAAGADIKEMKDMSYADMLARAGNLQDCFQTVARIPKPVIAAITGYALGGGCELSMCADFRVVADNAKLGQPEILLGVIPGAGGTQRLTRLVGPAKAKDICFTGRFVDAAEALAIGLADVVVPAADVYDKARRDGVVVQEGRRSPSRPRRRRSTRAWRWTSMPRCGSSRRCSPACSPRRTAPSAWSRSSRTARARRSSSAADRRRQDVRPRR